MAFSGQTKYAMKERASVNGHVVSEITGCNTMPMEAAHIDHDKSKPTYDSPENGHMLTVEEHMLQHNLYAHLYDDPPEWFKREWVLEQIGLHNGHNQWAKRTCWERFKQWEYQQGIITEGELRQLCPNLFSES